MVVVDAALDVLIELVLRGLAVDPAHRPLARVVDDVRMARDPAPTPSGELRVILAGEYLADHSLSPGAARARRIARYGYPVLRRRTTSGHRSQ